MTLHITSRPWPVRFSMSPVLEIPSSQRWRSCWRPVQIGTKPFVWPISLPASWSASSELLSSAAKNSRLPSKENPMYIVVTGAAGFIGSNIVKALNERGIKNIIAVDNLTKADKFKNLIDCDIVDYIDKHDFIERIQAGHYDGDIEAILHEGACSDTMETDGRYMMENNYRYSLILLDWCQDQDVQFLYASSAATYGASNVFKEERQYEGPLNVYGYSKFLFDQIVRQRLAQNPSSQIVGFRYFNVYGPREYHKERMASVAFHNCNQLRPEGKD